MEIRNAKDVNAKGKQHEVVEVAECVYDVTSGTSGKVYRVTLWQSKATCTCNWGKYHANSACSHVQAVYEMLAQREGRTTSAWSDLEAAKRQRKPVRHIGNGVYLTTRKAKA
jgi:uncharacterized Zn finger protein